MISGLLLTDKPKGYSSYDVIREVKQFFPKIKIGHFGTLDPIATGLLILAFGSATKFFNIFKEKRKTYVGTIQLGLQTDTFDLTGKIIKEIKDISVSKKELQKILKRFEGEITQIPPMYSAKKYKGKPLYKFAREGKKIERKPVKISIDKIELLEFNPPFFEIEVVSSGGTYIRSIANDIGEILKTGAVLADLRRKKIGGYKVEHALTIDEIKKYSKEKNISKFIIPLETILPEYPKVILSVRGSILASNGTKVPAQEVLKVEGVSSEYFKLFNDQGKFLCLAKPNLEERIFEPVIVLR